MKFRSARLFESSVWYSWNAKYRQNEVLLEDYTYIYIYIKFGIKTYLKLTKPFCGNININFYWAQKTMLEFRLTVPLTAHALRPKTLVNWTRRLVYIMLWNVLRTFYFKMSFKMRNLILDTRPPALSHLSQFILTLLKFHNCILSFCYFFKVMILFTAHTIQRMMSLHLMLLKITIWNV